MTFGFEVVAVGLAAVFGCGMGFLAMKLFRPKNHEKEGIGPAEEELEDTLARANEMAEEMSAMTDAQRSEIVRAMAIIRQRRIARDEDEDGA